MFSYFNFVNYDFLIFVVGFVFGIVNVKDIFCNVLDFEFVVINIIFEIFFEVVNFIFINVFYGVLEWEVVGFMFVYDCEIVKVFRVKEVVFSVEVKVDSVREFDSCVILGKKVGIMVMFEGMRFWVREDVLNEEKNLVDLVVSLMFF